MQPKLTSLAKSRIDEWLTKYPPDQRQSAIIYALMQAQDDNGGWLSSELIEEVAQYLGIPEISAYEVATFYTMFELEPIGRHKIQVCTNISCMLNGSERIIEHLKRKLNIDINETTPDGRYTLKEVECIAACGGAPALQVGRETLENLDLKAIDALLERLE